MPRSRLLPALVLSALLGLAACSSGGGSPQVATAAGDRTSADAGGDRAEKSRKWADCMRGEGIVVFETPDGVPTVDQDKTPIDKIAPARAKCRTLEPAATTAPKLAQQDLEKRRAYSACLRQHGFADYPDPDPETGEARLTDELARRLKYDQAFHQATEACRDRLPKPSATADAVLGG